MAKDKKKRDAFSEAKTAATGDVLVAVLVDETGSMRGLEEAVVTGVNRFVHEFTKGKGTARVTIGKFDTHPGEPRTRWTKPTAASKAEQWTSANYFPRGMTPLYDAIVDAVSLIEKERDGDEVGFLAIITDGNNNSSETTVEGARAALRQLKKRGDGIVFLGANIDVDGVATSLGLTKKGEAFAFTASRAGTQSTFATTAALGTSRRYAGSGTVGQMAYASAAQDVYDKTGGVIPEADDEADDDDD